MASQVPGFEYDIFISYRQKDNKGERWVSEFVEALETELESTFKEEISVYFDINPHDGLLDTYDVDASLERKLKCLVFIPIISRTYCDPKSFAWQHEFKAFVEQASKDQFGLKIGLPNGNVISRVLPVRIHDLEITDLKLFESVLGGMMRGVDFVYKTSGVNRPLRPTEDHPHDNANKTFYRDQINKVANSIRDIVLAIKDYNPESALSPRTAIWTENAEKKRPGVRYLIISLLVILLSAAVFLFVRYHYSSDESFEHTIAVLPFERWFSDKDYSYLGDAVASQINSQLRTIKTLYVISFNSTRRYAVPDLPPARQIGKECGANFLIQGAIELTNNNKNVAINVQLVNTRTNDQIWDEKFIGNLDSLQEIRSEIILKIADELRVGLTPEEIRQIETGVTKSSDAYRNFLSANFQDEASSLAMMGKKYQDSTSYLRAIKMYDKAIKYDSSFALAYARRAISRSWAYFIGDLTGHDNVEKCKQDIEHALKIDPKLAEAQNAYGFYYYYLKNDYRKAMECFKLAADLDPGNWQPVYYQAVVYRRMGEWNKSQALLSRVLKYNPSDALVLTNIGSSYFYLRDYDSSIIFHNRAVDIMPTWSAPYVNKISALFLREGSTMEARIVLDTLIRRTGKKFQKLEITMDIYDSKFNDALIKTELSEPSAFDDPGDKLLHFASIHEYLDHTDLSGIYYDSALVYYTKALKDFPESADNHIGIGKAYAGLKEFKKAIDAGKRAVELSNDAVSKNDMLIGLAEIYIRCRDFRNAMVLVDTLLNQPSRLSINSLLLDPVWRPLRKEKEFAKLLSNYSVK